MFETLTATQATILRQTMAEAYENSRQLSREITGWKLASRDAALISVYNRELNQQAGMRSEIMGIRNQITDECFGTYVTVELDRSEYRNI